MVAPMARRRGDHYAKKNKKAYIKHWKTRLGFWLLCVRDEGIVIKEVYVKKRKA